MKLDREVVRTKRKVFMTQLLTGWLSLTALPAVYAVISYLIPPKTKEMLAKSISAGKIGEIPKGGAKIVRINRQAVIIVRSEQDQLKAFSAICTHLGCLIEYREADGKFHCNCHGSVFDSNGKNIAGPAPKPLPPYRVTVEKSEVTVTAIES